MSDARHLEEFIEVPQMCSICGERKPAGFWCGAVDIWPYEIPFTMARSSGDDEISIALT